MTDLSGGRDRGVLPGRGEQGATSQAACPSGRGGTLSTSLLFPRQWSEDTTPQRPGLSPAWNMGSVLLAGPARWPEGWVLVPPMPLTSLLILEKSFPLPESVFSLVR